MVITRDLVVNLVGTRITAHPAQAVVAFHDDESASRPIDRQPLASRTSLPGWHLMSITTTPPGCLRMTRCHGTRGRSERHQPTLPIMTRNEKCPPDRVFGALVDMPLQTIHPDPQRPRIPPGVSPNLWRPWENRNQQIDPISRRPRHQVTVDSSLALESSSTPADTRLGRHRQFLLVTALIDR